MNKNNIISKILIFIILVIILFFYFWHLKSEINNIQDEVIKKSNLNE